MKQLSEKGKKRLNIFFTVLYVIYLVILLVISTFLFIPYGLLRLFFFPKGAEKYMDILSKVYAALYLYPAGTKIMVKGKENLPDRNKRAVYVSNHQSFGDIPIIRLAIPQKLGFITKVELFRVPIFQLWLIGMKCIPIDRRSLSKAHESIKRGAQLVKDGFPMVIFAEGTRSGCNGIREFKRGSMKLAEWADADIVPITVDGAYKFTSSDGIGFNTKIIVTIHKPISIKDLSKGDLKDINVKLWDIVNSGLENPNSEVMAPKEKKGNKSGDEQ